MAVAQGVTEGEGDVEPVRDSQPEEEGGGVPESELKAEAVACGDAVTVPVKLCIPLAEALPVTEGLREAVLEERGETDTEGEPQRTLAETLAELVEFKEVRGAEDTEYDSSW